MALSDTKILVIAPYYRWFIKNLVETECKYVNEINVLAHHNYLSEISNYLPFNGYFEVVKQFYSKNKMIDTEGISNNVNVHLLSMFYFIPDGRNIGVGDKIAEKFEIFIKKRKIKFDLIHAHFLYPQGYIAIKLGKKFNVPVIVTAHGHDVYNMPFRDEKWHRKIKSILDRSDQIISVSKKNGRILMDDLKIEERKISVIPNGFDPCKFKPILKKEAQEKLNLPKDKKIILNVANLHPIKGQNLLIKSMENIIKERKDIFCAIVGGGSLRKKLERIIRELNLTEYVRLFGEKSYAEIPLWMNAADVFVLPSLNEGNPTVMFEALGVGLPFVGTKVGGIPEIINSENYGLLVEPANQTDLTEKIIVALNKKWEKDLIRKYAQQFSWDNISKKTLNIYETARDNYTVSS